MKRDEIPQDHSALHNVTKELCYALDENGNYVTALSTGWEVKVEALNLAWQDIQQRAEMAKEHVMKGEISPIRYYMELRIMEMSIVSDYTGFWRWTIKRHMKPSVFRKLSDKKLAKYAELFEVSIEELKSMGKK
jgi:hypothetical protein